MVTYLDKFASTIRKRQTEQIFKLLGKQRSTGQIRTVEEFTTKLDNLIRELSQTTLAPTLKVIDAKAGDLSSSEVHNHQLERTEDDLVAAFEEAQNIDQVQKAHQAIVKDVLLRNLQRATAELEAKIALYEFINNSGETYTQSIFSTFKESRDDRLHRTSTTTTKPSIFNQAGSGRGTSSTKILDLFQDPRTGLSFSADEDALIDPVGERLVLGIEDKNPVSIRNVTQLFDSDTITTFKSITPKDSNIRNMLDGKSGTYWTQGIAVSNAQTSYTAKLQFDFSGTQTVNLLQLEPASQFPFTIEKIYYLDNSNVIQLLQSPALKVNANIAHYFPTISTSMVILELKSVTKTYVNFSLVPPVIAAKVVSPPLPVGEFPPVIQTAVGTIQGMITLTASDTSSVAGAKVDLLQVNNIIASTTTDDHGFYIFTSVLAGKYTVKVTRGSFTKSFDIIVTDGLVAAEDIVIPADAPANLIAITEFLPEDNSPTQLSPEKVAIALAILDIQPSISRHLAQQRVINEHKQEIMSRFGTRGPEQ